MAFTKAARAHSTFGTIAIVLGACDPGAFDDLVSSGLPADSGTAGSSGTIGEGTPPRPAGSAGADAQALDASLDAHVDGEGRPSDAGSVVLDATPDGQAVDGQADASADECVPAADPARVRVSTSDAGILPVPSWIASRGGGPSVAVGDRLLWLFELPGSINMAAWGTAAELLEVPPRLQEQEPVVPLLPAAAGPPEHFPTATGAIALNADEALIFFAWFGWTVPQIEGLGRIARDAPQAEVVRAVGEFFPNPPPDDSGNVPWHPVFTTGPVVEHTENGDLLYLYACLSNPNVASEANRGLYDRPCRIARVDSRNVADGERYRYWDGIGWNRDVTTAVVVIDGVPSHLTVSFNRYLGKFLAVHSGSSDNVLLRWADRPEGPWYELDSFSVLPSANGHPTIGGIEHPALRDRCQRVTYVSYVRGTGTMTANGEPVVDTHLVRVTFE